jgi:hypothetical protein
MIKRPAGDSLCFVPADNTKAQADTNIKQLMGLIISTAQQEAFTKLMVRTHELISHSCHILLFLSGSVGMA